MYFSWLVFIALFTFAASTLYFYIFSRKQEKFMQYWGFSWIAYSMSLLCLLCFFAMRLIFLYNGHTIDNKC